MPPTVACATSQKHWFKPPLNIVHTFCSRTTWSSDANATTAGRSGDVQATVNAVFKPTDKEGEPLICTTRAYLPQHHPHNRTCWLPKNHHRVIDSTPISESAGTKDLGKDEMHLSPDNCLPRIIKPRKRRKKDRKTLAPVPSTSATLANTSSYVTAKCAVAVNEPYWPVSLAGSTMQNTWYIPVCGSVFRLHKLECTPGFDLQLNAFTDGGCSQNTTVGSLPSDGPDADVAESPTSPAASVFCNCKYCDPESDVWDIRQRCFSPTLMPPNTLQKGTSTSTSKSSYGCSNTINLRRSSSEPTSSKPFTSPVVTRVRSFSSGCDTATQNLLVSSQIVTSHNGHRDIEVKFFSAADSSQV